MFHVLIVEDEHTWPKTSCGVFAEPALRQTPQIPEICTDAVFDALCIDIGFPDCNGLDLLEQLRLLQPAIPVIVMSGEGTDANKARAQKVNK